MKNKLKGKKLGYILSECKRKVFREGTKVDRANWERTMTIRDIHTGVIKVVPAGGIIIPGPVPDHNEVIKQIFDD